MKQDIHIAPEFKALIPPLSPDEYAQLEENLLAEGCRDPLVLWHDVLIDGHNRFEICQKHSLPFQTVQREFVTLDDAYIWVAKNQLGRRNITDFVRAELALLIKPVLVEQAKANQLAAQNNHAAAAVRQNSDEQAPMRSDDGIAKLAGVSRDTVRKVEKIKADATPGVIKQVRSGEVSINAAAKVATLPKERQEQIAAAGPKEVKKAAAAIHSKAHVDAPRDGNEPDTAPEELGDIVKRLHEQIAELQASLKEALADNEMMGRVFDAEDRIKAAVDEAARQKAIADNAERTLAAKTGEFNERARAVTYWKNRAEKAEKALAKAAP